MPKRSSKLLGDSLATINDETTGEIRDIEVPNSKSPRDPFHSAHSVLAQLTGEEPSRLRPEKNPAAVELGRRGGLKGGKKRMQGLTEQERSELGRFAAKKRWQKIKLKVKVKE